MLERRDRRKRPGRHHAPGRLSCRKLRRAPGCAEDLRSNEISERHRHRYEVNVNYREQLEAPGCPSAACPGRPPAGDQSRCPRPSLVRRLPVPPGTEVQAVRPAPAVHLASSRAVAVAHVSARWRLASPRAPRTRAMTRSTDRARRCRRLSVATDRPLSLICGPCAIQEPAHALETAELVARDRGRLGLGWSTRRRSTRPTAPPPTAPGASALSRAGDPGRGAPRRPVCRC